VILIFKFYVDTLHVILGIKNHTNHTIKFVKTHDNNHVETKAQTKDTVLKIMQQINVYKDVKVKDCYRFPKSEDSYKDTPPNILVNWTPLS
jgi:hypothetical protein